MEGSWGPLLIIFLYLAIIVGLLKIVSLLLSRWRVLVFPFRILANLYRYSIKGWCFYSTHLRIFRTYSVSRPGFRMDCGLKKMISHSSANDEYMTEMGFVEYGCSHYQRKCKIVAPCCNEIFDCRHCHNDAKNSIDVDPLERHDIPRHEIERVVCSLCRTEQEVQKTCINCGVNMGNYYCRKCKFFDDDVSKKQFHCDKCGICRTGGEENFFHCDKCECCYANSLRDSHVCVERAMHHNCPVCFEYLFDTTRDVTVLPCGHTIHLDCINEMERHFQYSCPVCSKSYCDMTHVWEKLDQEVAATPMPEMYHNKMVWILCNDCGETSEVNYHILANKCLNCNSYNTRQTRGIHASCSSSVAEIVR